jgi:hypothetical protein
MAAQAALQYFSPLVVHEQTGWAHFLAFSGGMAFSSRVIRPGISLNYLYSRKRETALLYCSRHSPAHGPAAGQVFAGGSLFQV